MKDNNKLYMCNSNCVLSTIKFNESREYDNNKVKSLLEQIKFEGFISVNLLKLVQHLKSIYRLGYSTVKLSFEENNLILKFDDSLNLSFIKLKLPLIEPSDFENIKDKKYSFNIGFFIEQIKQYKTKELKEMDTIRIDFDFYGNCPIKFKVNQEHEFLISAIINNEVV